MNKIWLTIKKELRTSLRDRKSLLMMVLTPLFIPGFVFFFSYFFDSFQQRTETEEYIVGYHYELNDFQREVADALRLNFVYFEKDELHEAYENEEIVAYMTLEDGVYKLYYNSQSADSGMAGHHLTIFMEKYNNYLAVNYLLENDIDPNNVFNIITYETVHIPGQTMFINQIITMAFVFAIMSVTLSSIYAATDSTAGEKERGTLETLLTFPIDSRALIAGKYLASVIACIITAILCGILLSVSLLIANNMFDIYETVAFAFGSTTIILSFVTLIAFSFFISGVSIAIASFSKSYKEAQSALTPVSLLPMVPMFMGMLEIKITAFIASIPIVNHVMILNDIFLGTINYFNIGIMLVSTVVFTIAVVMYIGYQYKSEKILFS